jgi:hypothetical protein
MNDTAKWIRRAVTPVVVVGLMAAAGTPTGENLGAQGRKRVTATRIFTGADGQTHAEEIEIPIKPGASGGLGELSAPYKVTGLEFRRTPPNYFYDWHTAPRRQFVVTLSGRGEVELVGGKKITRCGNRGADFAVYSPRGAGALTGRFVRGD